MLDLFSNRMLYSLCYIESYFAKLIGSIINKTLGPFLQVALISFFYLIPILRKRINKALGAETYESCQENAHKLLVSRSRQIKPSQLSPYRIYPLSVMFFCLPVYFFISICTLCGKHIWLFVNHYGIIFMMVPCLFSMYLAHMFFWRKDRYLKYFTAFEKENSSPIIIWATGIGTLMLIVLLVIVDFAIMGYAERLYDIHHK